MHHLRVMARFRSFAILFMMTGPTWTDEVCPGLTRGFTGGSAAASPVSTSYCTAKTTSALCVPFLSATGSPSATIGPFHILSNDHVEGQPGIYLYSFLKGDLNFHGGKLCVKVPFQRLSTLIKTTDGVACTSCAGTCRTFSRNFNRLIRSGTDPMLTPGQNVMVQVRQRDPADPNGFGDNLSNGLSFQIWP